MKKNILFNFQLLFDPDHILIIINRYKYFLIGIFLIILLIVFAVQGLEQIKNQKRDQQTDLFFAQIDALSPDIHLADQKQFLQGITHPGYIFLGKMKQAQILAQDNEFDKAADIYRQLESSSKTLPEIKAILRIMYALNTLQSSYNPEEIEDYLHPLTESESSAQLFITCEILALMYWYTNKEKSLNYVNKALKHPLLPDAERERFTILNQLLMNASSLKEGL